MDRQVPTRTGLPNRIPPWGIVLGVALLTFFLGLGRAQLFDEDEPKNAECGREMFVRGDWLVPTFNEELRTDKPILVYWFMLTSYHVFGVSEFAARFWSAVLGMGTCLLTYRIGAILFGRRTGMWAGIILASTLMFTTIARASTPDSTLIFFTTLSLFLFVRLGRISLTDAGMEIPGTWRESLPTKTISFLAIYSAMALAVLAKGPVGVLLPTVVIGFFLYATAVIAKPDRFEGAPASRTSRIKRGIVNWVRPAEFFRIAVGLRPHWILVAVAVIALPWYVAVGMKTNGAWLQGFLGQHNVGRFLEPMEGHSGPVLYYPIAILIGFFPWSALAWPVISGIRHGLKETSRETAGLRFVLCWFTVYLVFFTFARTKLPNYILPCYPALALMTGWWFERAARPEILPLAKKHFAWSAWSWILAGAAITIGLGIAASILLSGERFIAAIGVVPVLGGILVLRRFRSHGIASAQKMFAGLAVAFILAVFVGAAPVISRHQDGAFLAEQIEQSAPPNTTIAAFNYLPPGLVFYAEQKIDRCRVPEDVAEVLEQPGGLLITRADRLDVLEPHLPPGTEVLARRRRFLRRHDVVILGRPAAVAIQTADRSERIRK